MSFLSSVGGKVELIVRMLHDKLFAFDIVILCWFLVFYLLEIVILSVMAIHNKRFCFIPILNDKYVAFC